MEKRRKYELKQRAERQEGTRRRITEAAVELHRTVGPARTTVSAIAELAGVQRLTVYRHFPDEAALVTACSQHWLELHPPPDPSTWKGGTVTARLRRALTDLYEWYAETEEMTANVLRDAPSVLPLQPHVSEFNGYLRACVWAILARTEGTRTRLAAVAHALDFFTWHSLERRGGLGREEAVELMVSLVRRV